MSKNKFGVEMDQYAPNEENIFSKGWKGVQKAGNWLADVMQTPVGNQKQPTGKENTFYTSGGYGVNDMTGNPDWEFSNPFEWGGNTTLGPEGYAGAQPGPPLAGGPPGVNQPPLGQSGVNQPVMELYDSSKYLSTAGDQRSGHITDEQSIYDKNNPLAQPSDDTLGGYDPEYFKNEYNQYGDWGFFDFMNIFNKGEEGEEEEDEVGDEGEEIEKTPKKKKSRGVVPERILNEGLLGDMFEDYAKRERPVYQYSKFGEKE